ncbi:unnamed protein product [[Candida] boidinii]|nr:hypothetical protein B5S33_g4766 [[Candida] boidinii]GME95546.1 unnamed protein product [[Candida] boidinii]
MIRKTNTAKKLTVAGISLFGILLVIFLFLKNSSSNSSFNSQNKNNKNSKNSLDNSNNLLDNNDNDNFDLGLLQAFRNKKNAEDLQLSKKVNELTEKLIKEQEYRIKKLEQDRRALEHKIDEMKNFPHNGLSLLEKLSYKYPYDPIKKFPAYVWQSWKYGLNDDRFGKIFKKGEENWALKNPSFVHELFNDDTANAVIHHLYINFPEILEAYDALPYISLRMDFFKYLILFAKGGVYADVDTFPHIPIPNWIPQNVKASELGMIIAVQTDTNDPNWRNMYSRRLEFATHVIQCKPGHPVLRDIIAQITVETLRRKSENRLHLDYSDTDDNVYRISIKNWTGAGRFTDGILKYFNDYVLSSVFSNVNWRTFVNLGSPKLVSDILVLPRVSFDYTIDKEKEKDEIDINPLGYVEHYAARLYDGN